MSFETRTPDCGSCYSCGPDKSKDAVADGWRQELLDRVNIYDCKTDKYIRTFVPSRARCSFPCDLDALSDWTPVAGKEAESYPVLLEGLKRLVAAFPEDKRLSFFDCHDRKLSFPFLAFADDHHQSLPDIAVSFPGQVLDRNMKKPHWSMFSMVIEAKATAAQDPFQKNSLDSCSTVVQLAVSARSLMHAHGLLATFVLGFYGDTARIARFDHTCAVVTQSLSLKNVSDLKTLQRFLWRFVNPCEAVPFVGCDPTIRRLTSDDEVWLKSRLALAGVPLDDLVITEARWAEVYDDDDDEDITAMAPKPYIMFKALDINGRLFSRATSVWLGIRDTRDEDDEGEVRLRVIKDAWRQLVREPESTFYDRLDIIPDDERIGLAKLLDGGDLGEREVRLWETAVYGRPSSSKDDINHHSRLSSPRTTTSEEVLDTAPRSLFMSSRTTALPSHRPMQQTFSWRLSRGKDYWHRERSHMRFVIDTVGKPITRFDSTQELVQAVWDAIQGHRQAMQRAGVLHRDVSIGNILIVDKSHPSIKFRGFLHDFDYSAMDVDEPDQDSEAASDVETDYGSECTEESEDTESSKDDSSDDSKSPAAEVLPNLKERTGTYYFMAVLLLERAGLIHEITHDLESFYWVLLWVVLRHTAHKHPLKEKAAAEIFKYGEDTAAVGAKMVWLRKDSSEKLVISNNKPLTRLLEKYRKLVHDSVITGQTPLTYEALEEIFVAALNSKEWPKNDKALDFTLPETRTRTIHLAQPKKKKNKKKEAKPNMGSKRKAQAEEDAAGNDAPVRRPRATRKRRRRG